MLYEFISSLKRRFVRQSYYVHQHEEKRYTRDERSLINFLKEFNNQHRQIIKLLRDRNKAKLIRYLSEVHWKYADLS